MVAVEVFVTIAVLVLLAALLIIGAMLLLGKRFHLDDWYRRDRRRLELYRAEEQRQEHARAEALGEIEGDRTKTSPRRSPAGAGTRDTEENEEVTT
jgi:hypothetical protein